MKPFLKWAGGKSRLVSTIQGLLPPSGRLVEPFMGSGAVFLGVDRAEYLVADVNHDLISLYEVLRERGHEFVEECRALFTPENNEREPFMALRRQFNSLPHGNHERAALFVYLNRHCFNGLCRYNSKGGFNVPFGKSTSPHFPHKEMLGFLAHLKARPTTFRCQGFVETMDEARAGDVVYCDPPYSPLSDTASFDAYAKGGFTEEQHQDLANRCLELAGRGVACIISNHDTKFTRRIYADALVVSHDVRRSISGSGASRGKAAELFAVFLPDGMPRPGALVRALEAQAEILASGPQAAIMASGVQGELCLAA